MKKTRRPSPWYQGSRFWCPVCEKEIPLEAVTFGMSGLPNHLDPIPLIPGLLLPHLCVALPPAPRKVHP